MRFVPVLIAAACLTLPASATKPTPETPEELELAGAPLVIQEHTYRFGDLLRSEPGTSVEACAAACHEDARCVAWSLTPPAYSAAARCELKANAGAASYRPGAVSGISEAVRMEPKMRYQFSVPEGYQPAPKEELSGGLEEVAAIAPADLLGESETRITAVMKAPAAPVAEVPAVKTSVAQAPVVAAPVAEARTAPVVFATPGPETVETLTLKAADVAPAATPPGPPPPAQATAFAVPVAKPVARKPEAPKAPIILEPSRTALPPPAPSLKADAQSEATAEASAEAGS